MASEGFGKLAIFDQNSNLHTLKKPHLMKISLKKMSASLRFDLGTSRMQKKTATTALSHPPIVS